MSTLHQLYRYYDKDDVLLYVGISGSAVARMAQHKSTASWYADFSRMSVENHTSRKTLESAEAAAIAWEKPLHNIALNSAKVFSVEPYDMDLSRLAFKANMRAALKSAGFKQSDMATMMEVTQGAIAQWLSDAQDAMPKPLNIARFCLICGISPNELFDEFKAGQKDAAA